MQKRILPFLFLSFLLSEKDYFQQDVAYDIIVELDDDAHTLSAYEKIIYTNNSPDTLNFIWFHLWPNAYKNDSTALAKQFIRLGSTRFKYTKEKNRGYIDSLNFSVDGVKAEWKFHPEWIDVAKVTLPKPLPPKETVLIETPFFVKLPKVISRLGHTGKHYEITQWYPKPAVYDVDGWHPMPYLNMGEFYSEFGSFDVKITLPKEYRVMATGDLVNSESELAWLDSLASLGESLNKLEEKEFKKALKKLGEKKKKNKTKDKDVKSEEPVILKTVQFQQDRVHDFAWFADPNWIVQKGLLDLESSNHQVTLWSMYLPKNAEMWKFSIDYLHDSGYWYSHFYGDYPYNHITAVDGDMSAGGGMEYPNITVISRDQTKDLLEYVIMHEVGHNWFYGMLGNNERDATWLDEGLNQYSNIRYWEKKYGDRDNQIILQDLVQNKLGIAKKVDIHFFNYMGFAGIAKSMDAQPLNISADENFSYTNYGQNYARPAVMMRFLQHYIGENKMDQIMQDYFETWKFRHPKPHNFFSIFDKHLEEDLGWFFENVFESTSFIDFGISKRDGHFYIDNKGTFNTPIEVAYYDKNGHEISREWVKTDSSITFLKGPPDSENAAIDPDQYMPDIFRGNNVTQRKLSAHFIFERPSYHDIDINFMPWIFSYNTYNGFTPGLTLWNGFTPGHGKRGTFLNLLYDVNNNKVIGRLGHQQGFDKFSLFHSGTWRFNIGDSQGRQGLQFGLTGTMKKSLTRTPISYLNIDLFYHNLDRNALDQNLYDSGDYLIASIKLEKKWTPDLFKNYYISSYVKTGSSFSKANLKTGLSYKMSRKLKTDISLGFETFLISKNIPKQYRSYLFGSVDPDFQRVLVLNRTEINNGLGILENTYYGSGNRGKDTENPTLSTDQLIWHLKLDQSVPYFPGKFFIDISGGSSLPSPQYLAVGVYFGPLLIPLFQSWDQETVPGDINWIKNRIRLNFSSSFSFGFNN